MFIYHGNNTEIYSSATLPAECIINISSDFTVVQSYI